MNSKQITGIVLVLAGVAMLLTSQYIKSQVLEGKQQISSAQKKVDTANQLFSVNPVSKEVGKGLTGGAQRKIDEGRGEVAHYEQVAQVLNIGGIGAIIVGGVIFLLGRKKR
ncbi:MAG: hypothetical protein JSS32_03945 [Verrucomicrobia bacterium]|nr:hypothetical protein [Verrucomicrobiota bacterium]